MNSYLTMSITGGGALGIGPLNLLRLIESELHINIGKRSIAFAGTSTGAIIAACLNEGMSATEIFELYDANLKRIFTKYSSAKRCMPTVPTYDNSNLKKLLKTNLKGKCGDWFKPIFIPTTVLNNYNAEKVWDIKDKNIDKWFAVLTSASAPTYFDVVKDDSGNVYGDGGLWKNSPETSLYSGLKASGHDNYRVLCLGTGMRTPSPKVTGNMTLVGWAKYLLTNFLARSGNSGYFELCANIGTENVLRVLPQVSKNYDMDDLDVVNEVKLIWERYYYENKKQILDFVNGN